MAKVLVWFDGSCPLCTREIALMRRLDRAAAIQFIDLSNDQTQCPLDKRILLERFHAQENDTIYSGAAAFAAMWRAIPLLRPIGVIARNRYVLAGLEQLYLLFLRFRPNLQNFMRRIV